MMGCICICICSHACGSSTTFDNSQGFMLHQMEYTKPCLTIGLCCNNQLLLPHSCAACPYRGIKFSVHVCLSGYLFARCRATIPELAASAGWVLLLCNKGTQCTPQAEDAAPSRALCCKVVALCRHCCAAAAEMPYDLGSNAAGLSPSQGVYSALHQVSRLTQYFKLEKAYINAA